MAREKKKKASKDEATLEGMIKRLEKFQSTKAACQDAGLALQHLRTALAHLREVK